jgi:hypothetical protein
MDTRASAHSVANKFNAVAPVWFYTFVEMFVKHKDSFRIWGGSTGSILLARTLVALSFITESSKFGPNGQVLAADLFDLAWTFRHAEVPEVRSACLYTVATCVQNMSMDELARLLHHRHRCQFLQDLQAIAMEDTSESCRTLAAKIVKGATSVVDSIDVTATALRM